MTTLQTIRTLTLTGCVCLLSTSELLFAEQFAYQDAASKCDREIQTKLTKVSDDYAHELNALMDTIRLRGDLEKTLAIKKERERFASEKTLEEKNLVEVPVQLRELQQQFLAAPRRASEDIAKSYVVKLEDAERKLTIDDKLDEAISAQQEIDKILKKYGIVNPAKGSEIQTQDLPKYIAMSRDVKIPTVFDGQQVGYTGLSKGDAYRLIKVDGSQVTIRVDKSNVVIPVDDTDLLKRIERKQKGLSEEDAAEAEARASAQVASNAPSRLSAYLRNSTWTWGGGGEISFDETLNIRQNTFDWTARVLSIRGLEMRIRLTSLGRATGVPLGAEATLRFSSDLTSYSGRDFNTSADIRGRLIRKH